MLLQGSFSVGCCAKLMIYPLYLLPCTTGLNTWPLNNSWLCMCVCPSEDAGFYFQLSSLPWQRSGHMAVASLVSEHTDMLFTCYKACKHRINSWITFSGLWKQTLGFFSPLCWGKLCQKYKTWAEIYFEFLKLPGDCPKFVEDPVTSN